MPQPPATSSSRPPRTGRPLSASWSETISTTTMTRAPCRSSSRTLAARARSTDHGDGTFTLDPGNDFDSLNEGEEELVTFNYLTKDSQGALSAPATVTITVAGVNDAPVASDVAAAAKEDGPVVIGSYVATDVDDASTRSPSPSPSSRPKAPSPTMATAPSPSIPATASRTWAMGRPETSPSNTPPRIRAARLPIRPPAPSPSPASTTDASQRQPSRPMPSRTGLWSRAPSSATILRAML